MDIKWPEGSQAKIDSGYTKWVDGVEYNLDDGEWVKNENSWSFDEFKKSNDFVVIERPIETVEINWDKQPSAEHVWLELGYGYGFGGFWAVKVGDEYVIGNIKIYEHSKDILSIHQAEPTDPQYMPKGGECEYQLEEGSWEKCFFIGKSKDGRFVYEIHHCLLARSDLVRFRPIKTDREQFIEQAEAMRESGDEYYDLLSRMHDNGARFK